MSGLEAVAHALAGSTGGIVAMTLLYPLENIRTRLQVQVKRKEAVAARPVEDSTAAANAAAAVSTPVPAVPLVHTHDHAASSPVPEECISPETPYNKQQHAATSAAAPFRSVRLEAQEVPLNTPRRTLPPAAQPLTCLACLSERAPAAASSSSSSVASSPSGTFVLPSGEIVYDFRGSVDCVQQVIAREGVGKLYSGLSSAVVGVGVSSAVYFFFYYSLKTLVLASTGAKSMGPLHNLGVASVSGILNVFITLPIWLVNTRMTVGAPAHAAPYKGLWDAIQRIHAEEGFTGFYRGLVPSLILVSNPAIQFVVYEQCIRILSKQAAKQAALASALVVSAGSAAAVAGAAPTPAVVRLSSLQYFLLGAFAKAVATVMTYPYQVVKSRQQASKGGGQTTAQLVGQMWREEGPGAFFNGMNAKMSQTVLNSAFMFAVYERLLTVILKFLRWVNNEYSHLPKPAP